MTIGEVMEKYGIPGSAVVEVIITDDKTGEWTFDEYLDACVISALADDLKKSRAYELVKNLHADVCYRYRDKVKFFVSREDADLPAQQKIRKAALDLPAAGDRLRFSGGRKR